jgi:hypothetical protein
MKKTTIALIVTFATIGLITPEPVSGQGGGGQAPAGRGQGRGQGPVGGQASGGRGGPQAPAANLPATPTAVTLPTMSAEITGPGPMFDSAPSLAPEKGLAQFGYEATEYVVSGTANGQPYRMRMVVRKPIDNARFSGLVLVEAMHGSGAAHMFEYTSIYTMSSGHAAVEILTTSPMQFVEHNQARYKDLQLGNGQTNEILAQVGSLIRSGAPLGGLPVRKMVLAGTSMTAGVLINYLPAHMVYRTPKMERIYDGFMPTSNGATIQDIDVPIVHLPTMHEVAAANITRRQDSDEPGKQYRLYEFSGIAHIDTRDSVRMQPNPCAQPLSTFPVQAYMSVGLHHLFNWIDKGIVPPRADRIWLDRNEEDGSQMALDEHGNPRGGIRNPYVDVPTAKYVIRPAAASPMIPNPSAYIATRGAAAATQMCNLGSAQLVFSKEKLKDLYRNKRNYVSMVERKLNEAEKAGWSLPVYRDMILGDAAKVDF